MVPNLVPTLVLINEDGSYSQQFNDLFWFLCFLWFQQKTKIGTNENTVFKLF